MPTLILNPDIVNAAIEGLEQKKLHIDSQIAELRALFAGNQQRSADASKVGTGKKKKPSAESIQRMREGQQRRWAKQKRKEVESQPGTAKQSRTKRKLSAAGKAAIVAALKKRWAAKKAAKS